MPTKKVKAYPAEKANLSIASLTVKEFHDMVSAIVQNAGDTPVSFIRGRANLAKKLGVSTPTVLKWERQGTIRPHSRKGNVIFYDLEECRKQLGQILF